MGPLAPHRGVGVRLGAGVRHEGLMTAHPLVAPSARRRPAGCPAPLRARFVRRCQGCAAEQLDLCGWEWDMDLPAPKYMPFERFDDDVRSLLRQHRDDNN